MGKPNETALMPVALKTLRFCESCCHERSADYWRMLLRKRALPSHTRADAPGQLSLRKLPARRRSAGCGLDYGAAIEFRN